MTGIPTVYLTVPGLYESGPPVTYLSFAHLVADPNPEHQQRYGFTTAQLAAAFEGQRAIVLTSPRPLVEGENFVAQCVSRFSFVRGLWVALTGWEILSIRGEAA